MAKTLTIGEIAAVEDFTGRQIDDENQPRGKYLMALTWVLKKRTDPAFTIKDVQDMDVTESEAIISEYFDTEDPK